MFKRQDLRHFYEQIAERLTGTGVCLLAKLTLVEYNFLGPHKTITKLNDMKFNTVRWMTVLAAGGLLVGNNLLAADPKVGDPKAPAIETKPGITPGGTRTPVRFDRVTQLSNRLQASGHPLTDEQKTKIKVIFDEEMKQRQAIDRTQPREAIMAKMLEIQKTTTEKVKPILTPEQADQWTKMNVPRQVPSTPTGPAPTQPAPTAPPTPAPAK